MSQFPSFITFVRVYVDINDYASESVNYLKDASVYSRLSKIEYFINKGKASFNFSTDDFFNNLNKLCDKYPDIYFPLSVEALSIKNRPYALFDPEVPRVPVVEEAVIKIFQDHGYEFKREHFYGTIKRIGIGDRKLKDI